MALNAYTVVFEVLFRATNELRTGRQSVGTDTGSRECRTYSQIIRKKVQAHRRHVRRSTVIFMSFSVFSRTIKWFYQLLLSLGFERMYKLYCIDNWQDWYWYSNKEEEEDVYFQPNLTNGTFKESQEDSLF